MASFELIGMVCLVFQGISVTFFAVVSRVLKEHSLPYFRLMALAHVILFVGMTIGILWAGLPSPAKRIWKWVLFRGIFGAAAFVLVVLAVRIGAGAGDVAALMSINTVLASVLGRVFLNEPFGLIQALSLLLTVAGSILIARPSILFGGAAPQGSEWIGYLEALASGFCYAGSFICSRKAQGATVWHQTASVLLCSAICFVLLALAFDDFLLSKLFASPALAAGLFCIILMAGLVGWLLLCAGTKWCPAAVSATTMTTSRMVAGYLAQLFVFHTSPEWLTLLGAAFMLVGVVIAALARKPSSAQNPDESPQTVELACSDVTPALDDGEGSLAEFVAAEFGKMPDIRSSIMRQRHRTASGEEAMRHQGPAAQQVGVACNTEPAPAVAR